MWRQFLNAALSPPPRSPVKPPTVLANISPLYLTHCLHGPSDLVDREGWPWPLEPRPVLIPPTASLGSHGARQTPFRGLWVGLPCLDLASFYRTPLGSWQNLPGSFQPQASMLTVLLPGTFIVSPLFCTYGWVNDLVCPVHHFSPASSVAHGMPRCCDITNALMMKSGFQLSTWCTVHISADYRSHHPISTGCPKVFGEVSSFFKEILQQDFTTFGTIHVWGWLILSSSSCPVHCILGSIPGLYLLGARRTLHPAVTTK